MCKVYIYTLYFPRHAEKVSRGRESNGVNQTFNRKCFKSQNSCVLVSSGNLPIFVDSQSPGRTHDQIACQHLMEIFREKKWHKPLKINGITTHSFVKTPFTFFIHITVLVNFFIHLIVLSDKGYNSERPILASPTDPKLHPQTSPYTANALNYAKEGANAIKRIRLDTECS